MANNILKAPAVATKETIRIASRGGRFVRRYSENLIEQAQPDYIPPEILAQQAILTQFKNRFGVTGKLMDHETASDDLEALTSWTAYSMVDEGLADENTLVELRPLLPEDSLRDPILNIRRETTLDLLCRHLSGDYGVKAVLNSHPIMPTNNSDSPVSTADTWGAITHELDGMVHQYKEGSQQKLAMLAISESAYADKIFQSQTLEEDQSIAQTGLLILRRIGRHPKDNLLFGPRHPGVLEGRELYE